MGVNCPQAGAPCRAQCPTLCAAFIDPYIGGSHGFVSVTPMSGRGPVLLVLPEGGAWFEAYRHAGTALICKGWAFCRTARAAAGLPVKA